MNISCNGKVSQYTKKCNLNEVEQGEENSGLNWCKLTMNDDTVQILVTNFKPYHVQL